MPAFSVLAAVNLPGLKILLVFVHLAKHFVVLSIGKLIEEVSRKIPQVLSISCYEAVGLNLAVGAVSPRCPVSDDVFFPLSSAGVV